MFENVKDYLKSRIETISSTRKKLRENYNKCQIEIVEIDNQIKALSNQIDMAYEIFSPKNSESNFNHKEIKSLETKKIVAMQESIDTHKQIVAIDNEIKTINAALKELSGGTSVANENLSTDSMKISENESLSANNTSISENEGLFVNSANIPEKESLFVSSANTLENESSTEDLGASEAAPPVSRFGATNNHHLPSVTRAQTSSNNIEDIAEKLDFCVKIFDFDPQRVKIEMLEILNHIYKQ